MPGWRSTGAAASGSAGAVPVQGACRIRVRRRRVFLRPRADRLGAGRPAGGVDARRDPRPVGDRQVLAAARGGAPRAARRGAAGQRALAPGAAAARREIRAASSSARSAVSSGSALGELGRGGRIVVAVDQLEELFTVCELEDERASSSSRWWRPPATTSGGCCVVCSLRADFYGRLAPTRRFAELLSRSHVLVGPIDRDELREAIEQPAARAGLEVERPARRRARRRGRATSPAACRCCQPRCSSCGARATGGCSGCRATARPAASAAPSPGSPRPRTCGSPSREREVARGLLLRLADGEEGAPERRLVPFDELPGIDGAQRVLASLTDARLLTVGAGAVELSHEALLREWPRYRAWLEEDRVGRQLHAHLPVAAGEWDPRGRDPADLYRGARLAAALEFHAQHRDEMNRLEREFVAASRSQADREVRRQRSQNRRLRGAAGRRRRAAGARRDRRRGGAGRCSSGRAATLGSPTARPMPRSGGSSEKKLSTSRGSMWRRCWRARRWRSIARHRPRGRCCRPCSAAPP